MGSGLEKRKLCFDLEQLVNCVSVNCITLSWEILAWYSTLNSSMVMNQQYIYNKYLPIDQNKPWLIPIRNRIHKRHNPKSLWLSEIIPQTQCIKERLPIEDCNQGILYSRKPWSMVCTPTMLQFLNDAPKDHCTE